MRPSMQPISQPLDVERTFRDALRQRRVRAFKGYSTGRWDGDTLVVDTIGSPDGMWLDRSGSPATDAAHITERLRRPKFGTMEIEMTVDDPKAYTRPWTITLVHQIVLDTDLIDYICVENEKDAGRLVGK